MTIKQFLISSPILWMAFSATSQNVEVQGQLKVSDMPTENTDELLVTRKGDGTLGTRQASSINPPADTTRTFERDVELTKLICNCPTLPPFMVESALANGYSPLELLTAGVPYSSLQAAGYDPVLLLEQGAPLFNLIAGGAPADLFIGATYQGGILFHIDEVASTGIVMYPDFVAQPIFGCGGEMLVGLDAAIGAGNSNTTILLSCADPATYTSCAKFATEDVGPGEFFDSPYTDWYLPSAEELSKAMIELSASEPNLVGVGAGFPYYSSTDFGSDITSCSTVYMASSANSPVISGSPRNSPQFRTVVVRTVN